MMMDSSKRNEIGDGRKSWVEEKKKEEEEEGTQVEKKKFEEFFFVFVFCFFRFHSVDGSRLAVRISITFVSDSYEKKVFCQTSVW